MINDWKNGDNEGLRDFLSTVDWKRELEDMDTENSWQLIKIKLIQVLIISFLRFQDVNLIITNG